MKENKKNYVMNLASAGMLIITTAALSACGGGGDDASPAATVHLSAVQQNYESVVLAKNGGEHYLVGSLGFSIMNSSVNVISTSYLYSQDTSMPGSPSITTPQTLTRGQTSLVSSLSIRAIDAQRYVVGGAIYAETEPSSVQISYVGDNVLETDLAADGKTVLVKRLNTANTVIPLSGTIASSPTELFEQSRLGLITDVINGKSLYDKQAIWQSGSAYMKVVRNFSGDTLGTGDCVAPATTGTNVTPCSTTVSALENFFPFTSSGTTYQLADGAVTTVAGVRAWVGNTARKNIATVEYPVFYQYNGAIYQGSLLKDGATLQLYTSGTNTQDFYIFLNNAALASVTAALTL